MARFNFAHLQHLFPPRPAPEDPGYSSWKDPHDYIIKIMSDTAVYDQCFIGPQKDIPVLRIAFNFQEGFFTIRNTATGEISISAIEELVGFKFKPGYITPELFWSLPAWEADPPSPEFFTVKPNQMEHLFPPRPAPEDPEYSSWKDPDHGVISIPCDTSFVRQGFLKDGTPHYHFSFDHTKRILGFRHTRTDEKAIKRYDQILQIWFRKGYLGDGLETFWSLPAPN